MNERLSVDILNVWHPLKMSVRYKCNRKQYYKLRDDMDVFYNLSSTSEEVLLHRGKYVAVRHESHWLRAKIIENKLRSKIKVWLVDTGLLVECSASDIRNLDPKFATQSATAFLVHLVHFKYCKKDWKDKKTFLKDMIEVVTGRESITLLKRGECVSIEGQNSFPVEIFWMEKDAKNPFSPSSLKKTYLSQVLLHCLESSVEGNEEEEIDAEDDYNDDMNGNVSTDSECLEVEIVESKWKKPNLPTVKKFYARGTFVDEVGQIFVQEYDKEETFKEMCDKINEKFRDSPSDGKCLKRGQDCTVRYTDNGWYRARFIKYQKVDKLKALVLLVDFGQLYIAPSKDIRNKTMFEDIPVFAFPLILHNALPENSDRWKGEVLDFMMKKVNYEENGGTNIIKVRFEKPRDLWPPLASITIGKKLKRDEPRVWIDLAEMLVEHCGAREVKPLEVTSDKWITARAEFSASVGFII